MIELLPFYLSTQDAIHATFADVRLHKGTNVDDNRRYSYSLINSLVHVAADYCIQQAFDHDKCVVLCTASTKESSLFADAVRTALYGRRHQYERAYEMITQLDLYGHRVIVQNQPGIFIGSIPTVRSDVIECDRLLTYFPIAASEVVSISKRSTELVLFEPVNAEATYYRTYINSVKKLYTVLK